MGVRLNATCIALAGILVGPLPPLALAQQSGTPAPAAEGASAPDGTARSTDMYDVAAAGVTVLKVPFNLAICGVGAAAAAVLFAVSFGTAYKTSVRTVEQGCKGPWVVTGDDLRPEPSRSEATIGGNP